MRRSEILVSMTLLWVVTTPRAIGQFLQQGAKLVGDGGISATDQGAAVAVSADGNTAVVGGPDDNDAIGAVWVFTRTGGAWNQQGGKLVGNGGANDSFGLLQQGTSVAISADGNTIISGAPYDNNDMGAVWVFNRSNGVWSQQGMKLVGTGGSAESKQGTSVALSADGNMAIVGGTGDNSVWTFIRVNGTWSQRGSKLSESFDCFGSAAALSADGNTALVGSFCEGTVERPGYSRNQAADGSRTRNSWAAAPSGMPSRGLPSRFRQTAIRRWWVGISTTILLVLHGSSRE